MKEISSSLKHRLDVVYHTTYNLGFLLVLFLHFELTSRQEMDQPDSLLVLLTLRRCACQIVCKPLQPRVTISLSSQKLCFSFSPTRYFTITTILQACLPIGFEFPAWVNGNYFSTIYIFCIYINIPSFHFALWGCNNVTITTE